jgi:hypothetical protein
MAQVMGREVMVPEEIYAAESAASVQDVEALLGRRLR